jgi:hypothetical protein
MPQKPLIGLADSLTQTDLWLPTELPQLGIAQKFTRRAIRLTVIEPQFAREARDLTNNLGQFPNRDVGPPAYIDNLGLVVMLQQKNQRISVKELAARRTGTPNHQLRRPVYFGFVCFAEESR